MEPVRTNDPAVDPATYSPVLSDRMQRTVLWLAAALFAMGMLGSYLAIRDRQLSDNFNKIAYFLEAFASYGAMSSVLVAATLLLGSRRRGGHHG